MKQVFENRLTAIAAEGGDLLYGGLKGIEKEALRVGKDGALSLLEHPAGLGSALTNRYIKPSASLLEADESKLTALGEFYNNFTP